MRESESRAAGERIWLNYPSKFVLFRHSVYIHEPYTQCSRDIRIEGLCNEWVFWFPFIYDKLQRFRPVYVELDIRSCLKGLRRTCLNVSRHVQTCPANMIHSCIRPDHFVGFCQRFQFFSSYLPAYSIALSGYSNFPSAILWCFKLVSSAVPCIFSAVSSRNSSRSNTRKTA